MQVNPEAPGLFQSGALPGFLFRTGLLGFLDASGREAWGTTMITVVDHDGRVHTLEGWGGFQAAATQGRALLDVAVGMPEAARIPDEACLRDLAKVIRPGGLLRFASLWPAGTTGEGGAREGLARRHDTLKRTLEAAGFAHVRTDPRNIVQDDFLAAYCDGRADFLGMERFSADAKRVETVFARRAPAGSSDRIRLGIIAQDLYYAYVYESPALLAHFDILKMNCSPFAPPEHYRQLMEFEPDALLIFRPDFLRPETFRAFRCPKIGVATEPLPRIRNGATICSEYV